MKISRRTFLAGTGVTAASWAAGYPRIARADPELDALRLRWKDLLIGSNYPAAAQPYATVCRNIGEKALEHRDAMTATGDWPDLVIGSSPGNITKRFAYLFTMACAYAMPQTQHTGSADMLSKINLGLNRLNTMDGGYNDSASPSYGNWYHWHVGSPKRLLNILSLIRDDVGAGLRTSYMNAIDRRVTAARYNAEKGSNRADMAVVLVLRGIIGERTDKLELGIGLLSQVLQTVTSGEGTYADGSHIFHTAVPYNGTYGATMLSDLAQLYALLAESPYDITDPNRDAIMGWVETSYMPFIYNGLMMDGVSGRSVATATSNDHDRGHGALEDVLLLSETTTPAQRLRFQQLVKGKLARDYWQPLDYTTMGSPAMIKRMIALMNDSSIVAAPEPTECRVFGSMDRVVHRRPNWAASISMSSTRTTFYEHGSGANVKGWHTSSGMLCWWGSTFGNGQYSDNFWPTVDPRRLPGTTVSTRAIADGEGPEWGTLTASNTWAGGCTDGTYGVIGHKPQWLVPSTLAVTKSWFCLEDAIVCLGAGISSSDPGHVETVVENRNLGPGPGTQQLITNAGIMPSTPGWGDPDGVALSNLTWAHLSGFGGYVFYGNPTIFGVRQNRTGKWQDINTSQTSEVYTTPVSNKFLTLYYNHGIRPSNAAYRYMLMPGATRATTQARSNDTSFLAVISNTAALQEIYVPSLGFRGMNFFVAGTSGSVTVSHPCSMMLRGNAAAPGTLMTITLTDPTQALTGPITVTWDHPAQVLSATTNVTVVQTTPRLIVTFPVANLRGRSVSAQVRGL